MSKPIFDKDLFPESITREEFPEMEQEFIVSDSDPETGNTVSTLFGISPKRHLYVLGQLTEEGYIDGSLA
jgi:hypothetical protein